MHQRSLAVVFVISALTCAFLTPIDSSSAADTSLKKDIVGTWLLVTSEQTSDAGAKQYPYGPEPKGILMLDDRGHFAQIFIRNDLPKVERRSDGTPEQIRAVVEGSLSIYGTYSVEESTKTISMHYEASSFATFNDTDAKRTVVLNGDELTTVNYATSRYTKAESKYRRAR